MAEYVFNDIKAIKVGEKVFDNNDINVGDKIVFHYDDGRPDVVMVVTQIFYQDHVPFIMMTEDPVEKDR